MENNELSGSSRMERSGAEEAMWMLLCELRSSAAAWHAAYVERFPEFAQQSVEPLHLTKELREPRNLAAIQEYVTLSGVPLTPSIEGYQSWVRERASTAERRLFERFEEATLEPLVLRRVGGKVHVRECLDDSAEGAEVDVVLLPEGTSLDTLGSEFVVLGWLVQGERLPFVWAVKLLSPEELRQVAFAVIALSERLMSPLAVCSDVVMSWAIEPNPRLKLTPQAFGEYLIEQADADWLMRKSVECGEDWLDEVPQDDWIDGIEAEFVAVRGVLRPYQLSRGTPLAERLKRIAVLHGRGRHDEAEALQHELQGSLLGLQGLPGLH